MENQGHIQSLFSQKLDRAVFGTYFLGSVVPTAILAVVLHRNVLPTVTDDQVTASMIGMLIAVGMLSLASFFALRRLVRTALRRMDSDNHRLSAILAASEELTAASHIHAVADAASGGALALTEARAAYVLLQADRGKPLLVCESAGEDPAPLYQSNQERIGELLDAALASGTSTFLTCGPPRAGLPDEIPSAMAAVPLTVANGLRGAFVLLHTKQGAFFQPEQMDAVAAKAQS